MHSSYNFAARNCVKKQKNAAHHKMSGVFCFGPSYLYMLQPRELEICLLACKPSRRKSSKISFMCV